MRLGLDGGGLSERGATVALFDYARNCREILGLEPVVLFDPDRSRADVLARFAERFPMHPYAGDGSDYRRVTGSLGLDVLYQLKAGSRDRREGEAGRSVVHAIFRSHEPHGDVYAYVSRWLSEWMTGGAAPWVPHMVDLPEPRPGARARLGLPRDAFAVVRHGGFEEFNIPFAHVAVAEALERRRNLHFVFLNTRRFIDHERALFLPAVIDRQEKADTIAACDVGLHARRRGETFGLAVAECLSLGLPVAAWRGGLDQNHAAMIPEPGWLYRTRADLVRWLCDYEPLESDREIARRAATPYAPRPVMERFARVFLEPTAPTAPTRRPWPLMLARRAQTYALRARWSLWLRLSATGRPRRAR